MANKTLFAIGICLFIAGALANSAIRIRPQMSLTPVEEGYHSSLGVVNGVRTCGGNGKYIQFWYESCEGSGICQVPGDSQYRRGELEFIPGENAKQLGLRLAVVSEGEVSKVYERPIPDSEVKSGQRYVLTSGGGATKELKGKQVTAQYTLYQVEDNEVALCIEADFQIV